MLGFLRARLLRLYCTAVFPPIFLHKGPLCSCAELLQSCALCSSVQCRTVKLRLPAVRELFWGMLGRGKGGGGVLVFQEVGTMKSLHWSCEMWFDCVERKRHAKNSCVCNGSSRVSLPRRRSRRACVRYMYILYVCVHICVCVYVCRHLYMYIYMHVCMYLYIYAFIHMCMCMCMHICA